MVVYLIIKFYLYHDPSLHSIVDGPVEGATPKTHLADCLMNLYERGAMVALHCIQHNSGPR